MQQSRYIPRYFCALDNPDDVRTWFLIDRKLGTPVFDDRGVRLFTRQEVDTIMQSGMEGLTAPGGSVAP